MEQLAQVCVDSRFVAEFFLAGNIVQMEIQGSSSGFRTVGNTVPISTILHRYFPHTVIKSLRVFPDSTEDEPFNAESPEDAFHATWSELLTMYPSSAFQFQLELRLPET